MQNKNTGTLEEAAQSYAHWWREAGFHTAIDPISHGWRQAPPAPFWQRDAAAAEAARAAPAAEAHRAAPARPAPITQAIASVAPPTAMPDDLPGFLQWIAQDASQPEAAWDGATILPPAIAQARLLVVVEMPAPGAIDSATALDPVQRRLLDAMLACVGIRPDEAVLTPLAARRPPGGLLDEATLAHLCQRMTRYLSLSRPGAAILFGDRTNRALIGPQWTPRGDQLHKVNHGAGSIDAVSLAGLDLLMSRPAAKAKSWRALRLLQGQLTA